jgi:hypothetical protein
MAQYQRPDRSPGRSATFKERLENLARLRSGNVGSLPVVSSSDAQANRYIFCALCLRKFVCTAKLEGEGKMHDRDRDSLGEENEFIAECTSETEVHSKQGEGEQHCHGETVWKEKEEEKKTVWQSSCGSNAHEFCRACVQVSVIASKAGNI